jgi:universal stress protein E
MLAQITSTQLHSINTFETPSMGPTMDVGWANIDFESIKIDTRNAHTDKMQNLLKAHDLMNNPFHVVEGPANIAIPMVAKEIDVQLLILGTVGRTGLSGAFIGNTAEHILANMSCDILTLKPNL